MCAPCKRFSHHHLSLVETQRQAGEWESFVVKKKMEGLKYALIEGCWHRETRSGPIDVEHPM